MKKRIFITGGHVTPALAVIDEIRQKHPDWELFFVGRKFAMEGDKHFSEEFNLVKENNLIFLSLTTGRKTGFYKIIIGLFQSFFYLLKYKPNAIVSFGGYIALPVVVVGWLLGIPSITHEQTTQLGLANKIIAFFAKKVCVSWEIGIPIRKQLFSAPTQPQFWKKTGAGPILYITGGSTGAQSLNEKIYPLLGQLLKKFFIIHQTGRRSYKESNKKNYITSPYFSVSDLAWIYRNAKIIISRAGANTVGEIAALGKVAIFVPLPWAANNEQEKNAKQLAGSSIILEQKFLTQKSLTKAIDKIMKNYDSYQKKAKAYSAIFTDDAAARMVDQLSKIIS